jgi:hypothetical protein
MGHLKKGFIFDFLFTFPFVRGQEISNRAINRRKERFLTPTVPYNTGPGWTPNWKVGYSVPAFGMSRTIDLPRNIRVERSGFFYFFLYFFCSSRWICRKIRFSLETK